MCKYLKSMSIILHTGCNLKVQDQKYLNFNPYNQIKLLFFSLIPLEKVMYDLKRITTLLF